MCQFLDPAHFCSLSSTCLGIVGVQPAGDQPTGPKAPKAGNVTTHGTIPSMGTISHGILRSVLPHIKSLQSHPRKLALSYLYVRTGHAVRPASPGSNLQVNLNHPPFPLKHGLKPQVSMTPIMLHADNCLTRFKAQRGPERRDQQALIPLTFHLAVCASRDKRTSVFVGLHMGNLPL